MESLDAMDYRFALSRRQLVALAALLALAAVLVFLAGTLTGLWFAGRRPATGEDAPAEETPVAEGEATAPEEDPESRTAAAQAPERIYELQLAARLSKESALPDVETLAAAGYQAYIAETKDSAGRAIYTVRIGPWSSMAEAAEAARAFKEHSGIDSMDPVIRHRPKPADARGLGDAAPARG